jgi:hypothetical protein
MTKGVIMKKLLLAALLLYCSAPYADEYIDSPEGRFFISALVCNTDEYGPGLLFGALVRKGRETERICWKYDGEYHIFFGNKRLTFPPDASHLYVPTRRGDSEDTDPDQSFS